MKRKSTLTILLLLLMSSTCLGWMDFRLDTPIDRLADNSAVDIILGGDYLWFATSRGISGTSDGGQTWITYNSSNGLNSNDVSALAYSEGRLWVGTAHNVVITDQTIPWGDGFNITTDNGQTFESYQPKSASFASMLPYDIAILDSAAWAPCFAGGLIRSLDYGQTWQNIFASAEDSLDFVDEAFTRRTNLYYSVVVDTFAQDTVQVWAGSAAGIHRYLYIDESIKLAGMRTWDISFDGDSSVWLALDGGLSRGDPINDNPDYQYYSWDTKQGLLSDYFCAVEAAHGLTVAAAWNPDIPEGLGFNYTLDNGESWAESTPDQAVGSGKIVKEIVNYDDILFAACSEGGLIRSIDSAQTWESIFPIDGETSSDRPFNRFYCVFAESLPGDTLALWAGTDSGLFVMTFDDPVNDPLSTEHFDFVDDDSTGQHVEAVFVRERDETPHVWIATHPVNAAVGQYQVLRSTNRGAEWTRPLQTSAVYDITDWLGWLLVASDDNVIWTFTDGDESTDFDEILSLGLIDSSFTKVEAAGDYVWIGSLEIPVRFPWKNTLWIVERVTTDPLKYDRHFIYDTLSGITGDFVTALGLQYHDGKTTLWAATQKTEGGTNGISKTTNSGDDWIGNSNGLQAWNFAFDDGDVYVASSQGLYRMQEDEPDFSRIDFEENFRRYISETAEFYAVRVVEDDLWVGSSDGIARTDLVDNSTEIFREFRNVETLEGGEPYASPVPVSPSRGLGFVRFHYHLPQADYVTIEIYDFAMNLVATPVDNQPREPREVSDQEDDDGWNLKNDNGDIVAAGVYFFKIEMSGREQWGKLMVLP